MDDYDKPSPRPFPVMGPGMRLWLLVALYFACQGAVLMLSRSNAMAWLSAGPGDGYPVSYGRMALVIAEIIMFAVPAVVYANVFPAERFAWFRLNVRVRPLLLLFGALAMILLVPGLEQVYDWCKHLITDPAIKQIQEASDKSDDWLNQMGSAGDLLMLIAVSAFIPAFCEELFFRASVQQVLSELIKKRPVISVWITAAFFAVAHFDVAGFPMIFLAGLILGYAFYWTGSLRVNIAMHFMFNATSLILSYATQHSPAFNAWEPPVYTWVASFLLSGAFLFLLRRGSFKAQA